MPDFLSSELSGKPELNLSLELIGVCQFNHSMLASINFLVVLILELNSKFGLGDKLCL